MKKPNSETEQIPEHPLEGTEAWKMIQFMKTPSKPPFILKGKRHVPTLDEIERDEEANYQLRKRMEEYKKYDAEAEAQNKEDGIIYRGLTDVTQEKHRQLIRLRAALATALKAVLQKKLNYAEVFDPLQYYEHLVKYGTPADQIMARIKLGDLEDKYREPEVVGTRITEEPYAHDANAALATAAIRIHETEAKEIAAQGDPAKRIIYR